MAWIDDRLDEVYATWDSLRTRGYALISDVGIGGGPQTRQHVIENYFEKGVLEPDLPEVHADRMRARDVVGYEWVGDDLRMHEHDVVTLVDRSGYPGERNPKRIRLLEDDVVHRWIARILSLVPPEQRYPRGTFGVNLFRTRTSVVTGGPHCDEERMCVVYVVDKIGTGGQTRLHSVEPPHAIEYSVTLRPGDIFVFDDERFLHDVTPIRGHHGQTGRRDAIVCTVDYPDSYSPGGAR